MPSLWEKVAPNLWHHVSKPFAYINDVLVDMRTDRPVLDLTDLSESPPFPASTIVSVPTGAILDFAGLVAPTGFLLLGADIYVSRTTYSNLFAVIGTVFGTSQPTNFKLPDTAGVVSRGVGTATGYTTAPSIALAEKTDDAFQGHRFRSGNGWGNTGVGVYGDVTTDMPGSASRTVSDVVSVPTSQPLTSLAIDDGTNGTPRITNESRVKSIGLNKIIKI